nr:uroporphyrinogen-III synthase [Leucobacter edaphi]
MIPRGGSSADRWSAAVTARGATPLVLPLIESAAPSDPGPLAEAAARWNRGDYDWVAITSATGASAFAEAGARPHTSSRPGSQRPRVAAVGPATAAELRRHGFPIDLAPASDFSGDGLAEAFRAAEIAPSLVLLPASEIADDTVESGLTAAGHRVERVTAYRTVPAATDRRAARERAREVDIVLVSSGSVARELAATLAPLPPLTTVIAIGGPTARALDELGILPDAVAEEHTVDGMLDAADALLSPRRTPPHAPQHA